VTKAPQAVEPTTVQLGVDNGAVDAGVTQILLGGAQIHAVVDELVAASMA